MSASLTEIGRAFLKLGCIAFGGPVAHLSYLHEEFVRRRQWLDDDTYADLVALCQFLPGPASSQLVFALGMQRAGIAGAFIASLCFTLPSAVLMIAFAYSLTAFGALTDSGWIHGLKLAAVAVVAQAVLSMGKKLCADLPRILLGLSVALAVLLLPSALTQLAAIALAAAIGWLLYRTNVPLPSALPYSLHSTHAALTALDTAPITNRASTTHFRAGATLITFAVSLFVLPVLAHATGWKPLIVFDGFYRAGALVFGGGHVVLPLLQTEVVQTGWLTNDTFLAGYGAAQALPGPLFTFAAYLGTALFAGPHAWLGGLWCLLAIFLPAWLLIGGTLPFWNLLRAKPFAQAALRGANTAVVGILLAALYDPVWKQSVTNLGDIALVLIAFVLLEFRKTPSWLVVLLAAVTSQFFLHA